MKRHGFQLSVHFRWWGYMKPLWRLPLSDEAMERSAIAMIITKALPVPAGTKVTTEDTAELISPKELQGSVPTNGRFINAKATKIEGEPAGILEYDAPFERAGMTAHIHVVALTFFQGATMIQVQFQIGGPAGTSDDIATRAATYRPLFDQMMNSIVFDDKWK